MTEQEFLEKRKQFYIESDTLLFRFPNSKHLCSTHAQWYTDFNIPWQFSIRGYLWETENHENDFMMIYWNHYGIPNVTCNVFSVIFNQFPYVKWIGLGCYIGKKGEIWEPQMKVYRNDVV
jgi:hypothetical protein